MAAKKPSTEQQWLAAQQAWLDAQPHDRAIDPDAFVKAMRGIDKQYGYPASPATDAAYRDYAVKNFGPKMDSVWAVDREDPTRRKSASGDFAVKSVPLAEGYQAAVDALLADTPRGKLDPEAFAVARQGVDQKYGYAVNPEQRKAYSDWAAKTYNRPGVISYTISDPQVPAGAVDTWRNWAVTNPVGAGVASYFNAAGLGIPGALAPVQRDTLAEEHPYASLVGDMAGMGAGTEGLAALGGQAVRRALPSLRAVPEALRVAGVDALYGAARGKAEGTGALEGALEFGAPTLGMHGTLAAFRRAFPTHFGGSGVETPVTHTPPEAPDANAARLARARAQGFRVDRPLYHGSSSDFASFSPAREIFLTDRPDIADIYAFARGADKARKYAIQPNADPNVRPDDLSVISRRPDGYAKGGLAVRRCACAC